MRHELYRRALNLGIIIAVIVAAYGVLRLLSTAVEYHP